MRRFHAATGVLLSHETSDDIPGVRVLLKSRTSPFPEGGDLGIHVLARHCPGAAARFVPDGEAGLGGLVWEYRTGYQWE
jgi:hypothetical protein